MVQTEGGYQYPSKKICLWLTIGAILIAVLVWWLKCLDIAQGVTLLQGLEGTVLIASAYTPISLVPPNGTFIKQILWILKPQKGTTVSFNQPMFFGGLFCMFLSYITSAITA